jgi:hypothetical protein
MAFSISVISCIKAKHPVPIKDAVTNVVTKNWFNRNRMRLKWLDIYTPFLSNPFSNFDSLSYKINHPINQHNNQKKLIDKNGKNLIK